MTEGIGQFDSRLPSFLMACLWNKKKHHNGSLDGLLNNLPELMELALRVPDQHETEIGGAKTLISDHLVTVYRLNGKTPARRCGFL